MLLLLATESIILELKFLIMMDTRTNEYPASQIHKSAVIKEDVISTVSNAKTIKV